MKKLFSEIPYLQKERITLREVSQHDAAAVKELTEEAAVYRYLPTFLFEKKYEDISCMISHLYDECFRESLILGIYLDDEFCGLAEMYGYCDETHKISVGHRLMEQYWGKGVSTETLGLMVDYLYHEKDIEIITASTMIENHASARVLEKNGFELVAHAVPEDWGYESPTIVDKWVRKTPGSVFSVQ